MDTKEEDTIQEIQRVLENDENADEVNEEEDLEEDIPKRKNRPRGRARGSGGGRRRNDAASQDDHDKPYVCDICGKRYKNRPGLSYHYAHTHLASEEGDEAREQETRSSPVHRNENHKPDCELDVREVSKCLSAFGMELPVGVKGNATCRNLTFFSPLLNGSGLGKAYRCTCMSAVSSRGYSAGKE
ncbi:hypothetical protein Q9233_005279 [Columba guinea]|nr:hypothetical protein Q9233_005279 [Columba guinea]